MASAGAEIVQRGNLRVSFEGGIAPRELPRHGKAPVAVTLKGRFLTVDQSAPPQLRTISLAINRNGRLNYRGLPRCHYHQIQPASTREAVQACRRSVVGQGSFGAKVVLPEQSPFPSSGRIVAFNGVLHGRRVIFAHIYGTEPLPQSRVLAFKVGRTGGGYRTTLTAELPRVAADWGYVSSVSLTLKRRFKHRGRVRSVLTSTLIRSCKVSES